MNPILPTALALGLVTTGTQPAWAANLSTLELKHTELAASEPQTKNPWAAMGLSLGTPLVLGIGAAAAFGPLALLAPLGLGAGYVYAGDPARGLWVGLGGSAAVLGGALASGLLSLLVDSNTTSGTALSFMLVGTLGSAVLYSYWAARDVMETTDRANEPAR